MAKQVAEGVQLFGGRLGERPALDIYHLPPLKTQNWTTIYGLFPLPVVQNLKCSLIFASVSPQVISFSLFKHKPCPDDCISTLN